ncbi:MAG: hypothetical protein K0S53_387 [Bacteroidetes bacterium]|jgi:hypothetical protein|nr:hypothetical protein [Bacteroidota bacterium]
MKMNKHNLDIEVIIPMLIDGDSYRVIAAKLGCPLSTLYDFMKHPEHSAHVNSALTISANAIAEKAESVLINAEGTMPEISRARELAQYYKWLAAKRNPKGFSDKYSAEIDVTATVQTFKVIVPDEDPVDDDTDDENDPSKA